MGRAGGGAPQQDRRRPRRYGHHSGANEWEACRTAGFRPRGAGTVAELWTLLRRRPRSVTPPPRRVSGSGATEYCRAVPRRTGGERPLPGSRRIGLVLPPSSLSTASHPERRHRGPRTPPLPGCRPSRPPWAAVGAAGRHPHRRLRDRRLRPAVSPGVVPNERLRLPPGRRPGSVVGPALRRAIIAMSLHILAPGFHRSTAGPGRGWRPGPDGPAALVGWWASVRGPGRPPTPCRFEQLLADLGRTPRATSRSTCHYGGDQRQRGALRPVGVEHPRAAR